MPADTTDTDITFLKRGCYGQDLDLEVNEDGQFHRKHHEDFMSDLINSNKYN